MTSNQVPELLDNQFRKELESRLPYVQTWLGYSFRENRICFGNKVNDKIRGEK